MAELLHIELGGNLYEGVADKINQFMGEDIVGRKCVVTVLNEKQDKRVDLVLYDLLYKAESKVVSETVGKEFAQVTFIKQKKGNK
tara:strand:+ start:18666 stop:18920 length:255 start_codon:yes stop_codon:yes gene_type:complete